jgi:hypothetical protein
VPCCLCSRDSNLGVGLELVRFRFDRCECCVIFDLQVASIPDPHRDGFGCGFSFTPTDDLMGV